MGMNRFKKLARKTLKVYKLAESTSRFAESLKGLSIYEKLRENANNFFHEFEASLKKTNKEYKSSLRPNQKSSKRLVNWIHKNDYNVISPKVTC
jgi:hypothetical protein